MVRKRVWNPFLHHEMPSGREVDVRAREKPFRTEKMSVYEKLATLLVLDMHRKENKK